jgi:acyl carrier protein
VEELLVDVAHDVKLAISKELKIPVEQLGDEKKLEELGAESLDVIEIIFALEEKYDIDISLKFNQQGAVTGQPGSGSTAFATVGDICRAVQAIVDAKAAE